MPSYRPPDDPTALYIPKGDIQKSAANIAYPMCKFLRSITKHGSQGYNGDKIDPEYGHAAMDRVHEVQNKSNGNGQEENIEP